MDPGSSRWHGRSVAEPTFSGQRIVLTGADSDLGARVTAELTERGALVVPLATNGRTPTKQTLEKADAVVHLARPALFGAVLDAAGDAGVAHVVAASSATVYGAWSDNPMPLTEDVPLRPNPGFAFAAEYADLERRAAEWSDDHPSAAVTILRLVPVLTPRGTDESLLSSMLSRPSLVRTADSLPPLQVLHVADAASAIVHVIEHHLAGTFNVAPEGSVSGDTARALSAAGVPVPLPDRFARFGEAIAWRLRVGGAPRAAIPYRDHAWIVASDRLRATGWSSSYTSEEALVACRQGSWWRELSPKRRQEVALGAVGGVVATVGAAIAIAVRAVRASRPASP